MFVAVNEGTLPEPPVAKPIEPLVFVQVYVAPATPLPTVLTAAIVVPAVTVWLEATVTVGIGLIVYVYVIGVPEQPLALGVTVIVAEIAALVVFVAVNTGTVVFPEAAKPIAVFEFVQAYVVPLTLAVLANETAVELAPAHSVWLVTAFTVGTGLTVIV